LDGNKASGGQVVITALRLEGLAEEALFSDELATVPDARLVQG
jgi:hypothetical protein